MLIDLANHGYVSKSSVQVFTAFGMKYFQTQQPILLKFGINVQYNTKAKIRYKYF